MSRLHTYILIMLAGMLLVGCGGEAGAKAGDGDPKHGEQLFSGAIAMNNNAPKCSDCHAVTPEGQAAIVGNNLSNIGNRAWNVVPGQSAYDYLRESIVDPDKHLVSNYQEGIMYRSYKEDLSPTEIEDLIAYLLTLKSGVD